MISSPKPCKVLRFHIEIWFDIDHFYLWFITKVAIDAIIVEKCKIKNIRI